MNAEEHLASPLSDKVESALEILIGDYRRKGSLSTDDIARIIEKRTLEAQDFNALLGGLKAAGISAADDLKSQGDSGKAASWLPPMGYLTAEDERRLANVMRMGAKAKSLSDEDQVARRLVRDAERARAVFVTRNQGLVRWTAKQFRTQRLDFEDLVQEGQKGLIRAVEMFDPDLGYKFSTYATWWIKQSIHRAIDDTGNTIRIPVHRKEGMRRLSRTRSRLEASLGRPPTVNELAGQLEWSLEKTAFTADLVDQRMIEIDAPLGSEVRDTLENVLLASDSPSPEDLTVVSDLKAKLGLFLESLPVRTQDILRRRFGIGFGDVPQTLEEIGKRYNLTRERIRQIESSALRRLKKGPRSKAMQSYLD